MPRRVMLALAAILLPLVAAAPAASPALAAPPVVVAATPPSDPPVVTDNDFVPERDLSDCVSALPQPNCGSDAKGGWRQALVFGVVVVALAFVAWRIIRTVRRNRRAVERTDGR